MNKIISFVLSTSAFLSASAFAGTRTTLEAFQAPVLEAFQKDANVKLALQKITEQIHRVDGPGTQISVEAPSALTLSASNGVAGTFSTFLVTLPVTPKTVNAQTQIVSAVATQHETGEVAISLLSHAQQSEILRAILTPSPNLSNAFAAKDEVSAFQKNQSVQAAIQQIVTEIRKSGGTKISVSAPSSVLLGSGSGVAGITATSLVTVSITPSDVNAQTRVIAAVASRIGNSETAVSVSLLTQAQLDAVIRAISTVTTVAACESKVKN